jgi:hypothetical protein
MKSCKDIFYHLFSKKNFKDHIEDQRIISDVFGYYREKISVLRVIDSILQIAVFDARLIYHFFLIKNDIAEKLKQKKFSLHFVDIRFFFKNRDINKKRKDNIIDREKKILVEVDFLEEKRLKNHIKEVCKNDDFHELLFQLYLHRVRDKNEK